MGEDYVEFYSKKTSDLSEEEFQLCSKLYSENYGSYSEDAPKHAGENVKLSANYYRREFVHEGYHVALAKLNDQIIGQAFYIREKMKGETYTWVLQLVVHKDYRGRGIGSKLLHSIWGFSNDVAWGLATSNPFTVKTLERTTLRHVSPLEISKHEEFVREICNRISYIQELDISKDKSIAFTNFFVDGDGMHADRMQKISPNWLLGILPSGHEWVAFTFRDQQFDEDFQKELLDLISFSEERLKDAYSRMPMDDQPWAKHSDKELEALRDLCGGFDGKNILDAGCGKGRHVLSLLKLGKPKSVTGVDISPRNIEDARKKVNVYESVSFEVADLRNYHASRKYDLVLCLYNVIGSFPDEETNFTILKNIYRLCAPGGYVALSVMNFELTLANVLKENYGDIQKNPQILFNLQPSDTMQSTGNVFDPRYYAIDSVSNIVYRKEQFHSDDSLPAEYVIRDKRYTLSEITDLSERCGFSLVESRFVQAGKWECPLESTDPKSKEILLILSKPQ